MKFLHKHRRIIGFILTVTVSVMLFVSSIPASADSGTAEYALHFARLVTENGTYNAGNLTSVGISYNKSAVNANSYLIDSDCFTVSTSSAPNFLRIRCRVPSSFSAGSSYRVGLIVREDSRSIGLACDGSVIDGSNISRGIDTYAMTKAQIMNMLNKLGFSSLTIIGVRIVITSNAVAMATYDKVEILDFTRSGTGAITGGASAGSDIQKQAHQWLYENFLDPAINWLGNFISDALSFVTSNFILPAIGTLGVIFQDCFNGLKPILTTLLDDLFLPVLNSILSTLNGIVQAIADAFLPIIADIINFFAPYYNKLSDIITNNFIDLVSRLSPLVNQFVTAITPSFESIVNNISKNISNIIRQCFIPNDSSAEYQEFVSMKNDVTNKFPIFNQLYSFVSALFDPTSYSVGSSVQYSNLICNFDGFSTSNFNFRRIYYYNFPANKSYNLKFMLSCLDDNSGSFAVDFFKSDGSFYKAYPVKGGYVSIDIVPSTDLSSFSLAGLNSKGYVSFTDICLYSVDSSAGSDFTVNVYGKNVSVLNFDWYMPYKHYGDICVIAFCYLAFVWHTFKRLPQII